MSSRPPRRSSRRRSLCLVPETSSTKPAGPEESRSEPNLQELFTAKQKYVPSTPMRLESIPESGAFRLRRKLELRRLKHYDCFVENEAKTKHRINRVKRAFKTDPLRARVLLGDKEEQQLRELIERSRSSPLLTQDEGKASLSSASTPGTRRRSRTTPPSARKTAAPNCVSGLDMAALERLVASSTVGTLAFMDEDDSNEPEIKKKVPKRSEMKPSRERVKRQRASVSMQVRRSSRNIKSGDEAVKGTVFMEQECFVRQPKRRRESSVKISNN